MNENESSSEKEVENEHEEDQCPICLELYVDKSILMNCLHSFCYECIQLWSKRSIKCPLCKQEMKYGIHYIQSDTIFTPFDFHYQQPEQSSSSQSAIRRRNRPTAEYGVHLNTMIPERIIKFRQMIYQYQVYSKMIGYNIHNRFQAFTKERYLSSPPLQRKIRQWIQRELKIILHSDSQVILLHIEGILKKYDIPTEEASSMLMPYLKEKTNLFWHELKQFGSCPFTISAYDQWVTYDWPTEEIAKAANNLRH